MPIVEEAAATRADRVSILLVDDRPENLLALKAILTDPSYNLVTADSGPAALQCILREEEFAVILLDVAMAGMDGFEVASLIKQRERSRHIPILFITAAVADLSSIFRGYSVGAVDYLQKPVAPEVVKAKVAVFVELFRRGEQIRRQAEQLRENERRAEELRIAEIKMASEKRYRDLAEAIPDVVFTATPDGAVTYFNQRWTELTGLDLAHSLGWRWPAVLHPDDAARFIAEWRRSVRAGDRFEAEGRLRRADGTHRWQLCRALPERSAAGRLTAWLGTFSDIHDQRRAEERRRFLADASDALLATLDYGQTLACVAHLAVPRLADYCLIYLRDEEGTLRRAEVAHSDPAAERALRELPDTAPCDPRNPDLPARVLRSGKPELAQYGPEPATVLLGQQGERPSSLLAVPVNARGHAVGAIVFATLNPERSHGPDDVALAEEIGHRASAAIENAHLLQETQRAVRIRDEFVSIASHELRTPLTALQLQLQGLRRRLGGSSEPAVTRKIETAVRQTERLEHLIQNLLDVSRISAGRLALKIEAVDLAEIVRETAVRFGEQLAEAGSELQLDAPVAARGNWDRLRIEQVVTNILSNAVKYGAGKPIHVRVEAGEGRARLCVRDQGIGISADNVLRIFGRFERAVPAEHYGGLGLGLYITRQIVEAHGGCIRVTSEPGAGSTFTVELPLAPSADRALEQAAG